MTGVIYLTYDQVVQINASFGGPGAGVIDENGIRAQLDRASQTFGGVELVPDIRAKAAVILHGIASTQYFHDGNKRTAWIAADLFLSINDHPLRDIPETHAEAFVLSVATGLFSAEQAAEWLTDARVRASDRLRWLDTAAEQRSLENGSAVSDVAQLGFRSTLMNDPTHYEPGQSAFGFLQLQLWYFVEADEGRDFSVTYSTVATDGGDPPFSIHPLYAGPYLLQARRVLRSDGPPTPQRGWQETVLIAHRFGEGAIVVWLDGEEAGRISFAVEPLGPFADADIAAFTGDG